MVRGGPYHEVHIGTVAANYIRMVKHSFFQNPHRCCISELHKRTHTRTGFGGVKVVLNPLNGFGCDTFPPHRVRKAIADATMIRKFRMRYKGQKSSVCGIFPKREIKEIRFVGKIRYASKHGLFLSWRKGFEARPCTKTAHPRVIHHLKSGRNVVRGKGLECKRHFAYI